MKKKLLFCASMIVQLGLFAQQSRVVSGTVADQAGVLSGVSVSVKGADRQVVSDSKGSYSLTVTNSDTLVFRNIGYKPMETTIGSRDVINVVLVASVSSLDEVVVVGYGTQTRRNVTGSVAKVDMKQTENLPNTNVTQAMRGRVAGVQFTDNGRPGQRGAILIRGPRSLSAGNNPLIVVDGAIFNGILADLNPNDIESIEILKDASAAAIYGSRAANGVVLITSKRGATEKPQVQVTSFYGTSDYTYKPKLLSPERYLQKVLDFRATQGLEAIPENIEQYLLATEATNYREGNILDPYELVSQNAYIHSTDLNISGNSDFINYYLSAAIAEENGLRLNDAIGRVSLRANVETKLSNWLKIGMNTFFSKINFSGTEALSPYFVSPYGKAYHADGHPTQDLVPEDPLHKNPIWRVNLTDNEEIHRNLFSNFYALLNLDFIKGLTFRVNYSPSLRTRHDYNFFAQDEHVNFNTTRANKFNNNEFDWQLENILNYSRRFGDNHFVDLTAMYGRNHSGFESTNALSTELSSDLLGWNNLAIGNLLNNESNAGYSDGVSYMARLNYRFKERYLFTVTMRKDGSSVFAADNKYATFPSASFAWVASDESFLRDDPVLDLLKFRVSYGALGNQAIARYQSLSLSKTNRYVFGDGGTSVIGMYPSNMANDNLKWETTVSSNAAIDFELKNGRFGGTFEVYNMDTHDLLMERTIPIITGYQSVWTNLGKINNKGIELTLNSTNIRNDRFEWVSNVVFSYNRNKIINLYGADNDGDGAEDNDIGNQWFIGSPINVAYDYVFDGIYQEGDEMPLGHLPGYVRLKDLNEDGEIDAANDRRIIGQTGQPKFRWGITNNLKYGNISLSVFVNAMQGWIKAIPELDSRQNISGSGNQPDRAINRLDAGWWTPENKSNTRPSLSYPNPNRHNYYVSRDFIRIQDVSLAYTFNQKLIRSIGASDMRVYLSGKNLATFTDWLGTDPESGNGPKSFPLPRTISAGINLSF